MKVIKENLNQIENWEIEINGQDVKIVDLINFYRDNVEKVNLLEQLEVNYKNDQSS